ncbi:unnamed protein product [Trichogramma brassicae]|uniref:Reverse transcriptase/retrotransposon-derived protein RNase H-like domain-containing protein n=1 Tax=Trichogramma brassicae TaxID=86971 RepID=A0A6H5IEC0_9HYME|nr:unnamed protein product [Trichogramma brassicae]
MEALVRLEAPSMVWAKIRELPIQAVMEKLQQRRLSISGDEETLRVRLFRARCKALPDSNQLDVPWDPETDEEPEQDEKSLNETILQTKNHEMEIDQAQGGGAPTGADGGCVHPADDRGTHGDDKTRSGALDDELPDDRVFQMPQEGSHMARACPESEDNVERKDIACQVCGQRGCNGAGVRPLQLLVRPFGKRAGGGAGVVVRRASEKSHKAKESDRADDALIRWLYRLEQQDKLKVPTLGEVLAHCEWPRDDTLIPMPGGGTISEWCLRDLSAAGERPAGQADEGIEKIAAEPCETRKAKCVVARLLRKDTPFVWGADQEQAFATLKQSLSEAPVLVRPDFDKEFAIQTDASDYAIGAMERNTNEEQRRSFAAVVRGAATGRTAPSVRPAMDERAGASSSERNASEEARASQEAFLRGLRCTHRRTRWTGRSPFSPAITAGNGRRGNNERTPTEEELPVSVDRPAALARASVLHRRARDVARTEEESRCWRRRRAMLEQLVAARQPVEKNGTARHSRRFFVARLKRKFCLLEEGEATATLRRSGETTEESARVPTPPLAPVQEPSALPLPPPVQQVSYVAGLHGLVFQPFAVQQQRLPQTEYPLDGQQQRQLRRPGPYQEQQQHRQLPRRQPQQHQREEVRVEVRPLSPVAGPSSLSGNTAAPARIRGENFGGLSRWGSCRGLTLRAERVLSVTNLDTLAASVGSRTTATYVYKLWAAGCKGSTLPSLQSRMEEEPKELPFEESRSEEAAMESARRRKVLEWMTLQVYLRSTAILARPTYGASNRQLSRSRCNSRKSYFALKTCGCEKAFVVAVAAYNEIPRCALHSSGESVQQNASGRPSHRRLPVHSGPRFNDVRKSSARHFTRRLFRAERINRVYVLLLFSLDVCLYEA